MTSVARRRYYPQERRRRTLTMVGDGVAVALVVVFALVGLTLHDAIAGLGDMARGVEATGRSVERTGRTTAGEIRGALGSAADAVGVAPVIGGGLGDSLRTAGDRQAKAIEAETSSTGRQLAAAGREGVDDANRVATLVGWLGFLVPTALLLSQALPTRLRQLRALGEEDGAPLVG